MRSIFDKLLFSSALPFPGEFVNFLSVYISYLSFALSQFHETETLHPIRPSVTKVNVLIFFNLGTSRNWAQHWITFSRNELFIGNDLFQMCFYSLLQTAKNRYVILVEKE